MVILQWMATTPVKIPLKFLQRWKQKNLSWNSNFINSMLCNLLGVVTNQCNTVFKILFYNGLLIPLSMCLGKSRWQRTNSREEQQIFKEHWWVLYIHFSWDIKLTTLLLSATRFTCSIFRAEITYFKRSLKSFLIYFTNVLLKLAGWLTQTQNTYLLWFYKDHTNGSISIMWVRWIWPKSYKRATVLFWQKYSLTWGISSEAIQYV